MEPRARGDLAVVLAALAGIVFGHVLRRAITPPEGRARARFTGLAASSVAATPVLARVVGDVARVEPGDVPAQAGLAFATGAVLAFFAEEIGRHVPALPDGGGDADRR